MVKLIYGVANYILKIHNIYSHLLKEEIHVDGGEGGHNGE